MSRTDSRLPMRTVLPASEPMDTHPEGLSVPTDIVPMTAGVDGPLAISVSGA